MSDPPGPASFLAAVDEPPLAETVYRLESGILISFRFSRRRYQVALGVVILCLGTVGCGQSSADPTAGIVVEAAAARLPSAVLLRWLAASPTRPTSRAAAVLVSQWIDAALVATAIAANASMDDSATVDAAITPDAQRGMVVGFWQARRTALERPSDRAADSVFALDRIRVFQLWATALPAEPDSSELASADRAAQQVIAQTRAGADFSLLVRKTSQDPRASSSAGFLPAKTRAELSPQAAAALWVLPPGGTSAILRGGIGLEVFYRAKKEAARPAIKEWLSQQNDSLFADSLAKARHLVVATNAVARLRTMAVEPVAATEGPPLAQWDGGQLTPAILRRWMLMATPTERSAMTVASDSGAAGYLSRLAKNEMITHLAAPNGVLSPEARATLTPAYRNSLPALREALTQFGSRGGPEEIATAFLDAGQGRNGLPGALSAVLRDRYPVRVNLAVIDAVVEAAAKGWDATHGEAKSNSGAIRP